MLFERHGPKISLTRIGRGLYRLAMPLIEQVHRLPEIFAEQYHGEVGRALCVGAGQTSVAYLLPVYLEEYLRRYPAAVPIKVKTGTGQQRLGWLRNYELDLIVSAMEVPPTDLEFYPLITSRVVLITPLDHPLAGRHAVTIGQTAPYDFVGHASGRFVRRSAEMIWGLHGVVPNVVAEVDGWGVITNYVAAGVGISLVPEMCISEHDLVCKITVSDIALERKYGAVTRRDRLVPASARRFLEIMVPKFSHSPSHPRQ